ncbi:membrane protein [Agrobacterium sp. TS43]|uniref:porin n=4 Tax=Rhizobium/Agrobacterium group TaxID=227290 RepID=UPI000366DD8B|nr:MULTISPECIES: porin [Agrobacterium]EPR20499.1 membrane protein [Agrobacterium radiobacter DSM 30147]KDR88951.1 membrane protein [Agrobacterium tumefaciens GW4]KVK50418.1 membrane protein [Agrobacterium sp. JL28]KVK50578.1 membrane protein [Agrobacterium sp. LY4]KVK69471.1 membrane protein [Agrobacterium sp. TS43]
MNIKSLLIGSAAALAAVSGAQAADAIVAAEPEPMEYVRVCDAFGTGFFYIPGTETCLKFQGYVRFQTNFGRDSSGTSDWDSFTRAQFEVDTRTDTELGALRGFIGLRGNADSGVGSSTVGTSGNLGSGVFVDQAFIELGGLKVGKFLSWWDDSLSGETDDLSSNALFNSIRYTYDAGSFWAGVSVDELEGITVGSYNERDNNIGVVAGVGAKFDSVTLQLIGGYDTDRENGSVRLIATAGVGPGTLGLSGVWASGANAYYNASEWAVAAEYAIKATDKLKITPGFQYYGGYGLTSWDNFSDNDAWKAGLTVDYKITDGLTTKLTANYLDIDNRPEQWTGFLRLQRSF